MSVLEIALLIGGALIFILSFLIPVKTSEATEDVKDMVETEVKKKVEKEIEDLRSHIDSVVDEAAYYAQEKTERSLERISNEKIMAVNEYSDTVLDEINKNHNEVMFLYDMLNDKHENLMNSVSEANEAAKAAHDNATLANEAANTANEAAEEASEAASVASSTFKTFSAEGLRSIVNEARAEENGEFPNIIGGNEEAFDDAPRVKSATGGKVRTLKWAAMAEQQAGESFEENEDADVDVAKQLEEYFTEGAGSSPQNALHNEILTLHRLGQSDVEIARELNMGVGEVSLIIGLHSKK